MGVTRFILLLLLFCANASAQLGLNSFFVASQIKKTAASGPSFPSGATHYWKMDEASGNSRADSVGSLTLTEVGGAVASAAGIKNNAAQFVAATGHYFDSSVVSWPVPLTIAVWVNFSALPSMGEVNYICYGNDGGDNNLYLLVKDDGNVSWQPTIDDAEITVPLGSLSSWHLIVATITGTPDKKLSIDGGTFVTGDFTSGTLNNAELYIAAPTPSVPSAKYDEACTWNRALTQQEVADIWNGAAGTFGP